MAMGGPGDHPLSDVVRFRLAVYGPEADEIIRKISRLCSPRELDKWWEKEIGWNPTQDALSRCEIRYAELIERAKKNGWEMPSD